MKLKTRLGSTWEYTTSGVISEEPLGIQPAPGVIK